MAISAADVKALRDRTGAGMMDCKKALAESGGDMDKAIEYLRKKGQKISEKRADREANQGTVVTRISEDGKKAIGLALNCETDFVARNEDFVAQAELFASVAFENGLSDVDAVKAAKANGLAISEHIKEMTGKIGEKIDISAVELLESEGSIVAYIHPGNQLAVLASFAGDLADEAVGRDVAMQIAAMNPIATTKDEVPADVVEKEIEIATELLINEGKTPEIAEKAARGKLRRFYEERVLTEQKFVKDGSISVKQYLKNSGAPDIVTFKRLQIGATA